MPFLDKLQLEHMIGENWRVVKPFRYQWDRMGKTVTVPENFVTDQASVPLIIIPALVNDTGNISKAAVVHDYIYSDLTHQWRKKDADLLFYDAMLEAGMPRWRARIAYFGVRLNVIKAMSWGK